MKLIVAICRDEDASRLSDSLVEAKYRVTRVATTGGFLKRGNTTLLIGVDAAEVDNVIGRLRTAVGTRADSDERRATIFVLDAGRYEQV